MSPKLTAFLAVVVTAYCAGILGAITMTPEVMSQIIVGVAAFIFSGMVVLGLWFIPSFRTCPVARQRVVIWIAAGGASIFVCILPLIFWLFWLLRR
jgi:hypothetical protein